MAEVDRPVARARRDIQALRAVAVGVVVVFHIRPEWMPGGFVGVDAFFVISGFLISAHLIREREATGTVRLARFWARRIRRLLPAALLVLVAVAIATPILLPMSRWAQTFADVGASAGYFVNWLLAGNAVDYFADDVVSPVQHYWSLSVEEQFYLVWPLLLLLAAVIARRRGWSPGRTTLVIMLTVLAVCLAVSVIGAMTSPEFFYFATPAHGWEFAAGGLVALWRGSRTQAPWGSVVTRSVGGWLGFALLVSSAFLIDPDWGFPGWVAIWPVAGVLLVIVCDDAVDPVLSRIIGWRAVQGLGDISYSLYLWHWPIIVFVAALTGRVNGWMLPVVIVAMLVVSAATYRFVENPFRRSPRLTGSLRLSFGLGAVLTIPVLITGLVASGVVVAHAEQNIRTSFDAAVADGGLGSGSVGEGGCLGAGALVPGRGCVVFDPASAVLPEPSLAARDHGRLPSGCWSRKGRTDVVTCHFGPDAATASHTIALIGDSHAGQYADALRLIAESNDWSLTTYLKYSCAWRDAEPADLEPRTENCLTWNSAVATALDQQRPDLVVTSSYIGDFELDDLQPAQARRAQSEIAGALARTWAPQLDAGTRVIAIVDDPRWVEAPAECLSARSPDTWNDCAQSQSAAFPVIDPQRAAARRSGAELLDLTDAFCFASRCPPIIGNVVVYRDRHHLTGTYSITLAPRILTAVGSGWPDG